MDRLIGDRFVLVSKIVGYLLNPDHPTGAGKALFFERFGFSSSDPLALVAALAAHPASNRLVRAERNAFGLKSVVECSLQTPDRRNPCIRTVWILDDDSETHSLVTAYAITR